MVNNNHAVLGLLALVVVASGCTGGNESDVTVTQNTGVTVQGFSVFPDPLLSGTQGDLTIRLQNTGEAEAEDPTVKVYNVPWEGGSSAGDQTWGVSGGDSSDGGDPVVQFASLQPPNPEQNIPSTSVERLLTVEAPTSDTGINSDYEFLADVEFGYQTNAEADVTVVGEERYRQERPTRSRPSVENTAGPIQIKIRTETPIVHRGTDTTKQVCFLVQNVGGGTASLQDDGSEARNKVELSVSLPNAGDISEDVEISRQTDQGGYCTDLGGDMPEPNQQVSFPISATAEYDYEKTTSTSVTVDSNQ